MSIYVALSPPSFTSYTSSHATDSALLRKRRLAGNRNGNDDDGVFEAIIYIRFYIVEFILGCILWSYSVRDLHCKKDRLEKTTWTLLHRWKIIYVIWVPRHGRIILVRIINICCISYWYITLWCIFAIFYVYTSHDHLFSTLTTKNHCNCTYVLMHHKIILKE